MPASSAARNLSLSSSAGPNVATILVFRTRQPSFHVLVTPPGADSKSDAIAVAIDHQDDYSVVIVLPYTLDQGELVLGETFVQAGADDIFRH